MRRCDYLNSARVIADHILVEKGMLPYTMEGHEAANRVMNERRLITTNMYAGI